MKHVLNKGVRETPGKSAPRPAPACASEQACPPPVHFVLHRHWHAEMQAGRKDIEYRAVTPYWTARLTRRPVTHAAFSCGYTARGRFIRPVIKIDIGPCPYPGWIGNYYRVHLGPIEHKC